MANTQGSNGCARPGKGSQTSQSRRSWTDKEEEVLLGALKELVAQGWKSDNGFRPGYISKLEQALKKVFPDTDIKGTPHIISRITTWKKNYGTLTSILSESGVGFNLNGDHKVDCDNEKWEHLLKTDSNAGKIRKKSWPMFEGWKEIFGKDRATGENAEDVMDAVNQMMHDQNAAAFNPAIPDYFVVEDDNIQNEMGDDSSCQSTKPDGSQTQRKKKRKTEDSMKSVCELLTEIHRDTNARLEQLAKKIGYQADLGQARMEVFSILKDIHGLSQDEQFEASEILADKPERLELFMGLPWAAREPYVRTHILKSRRI